MPPKCRYCLLFVPKLRLEPAIFVTPVRKYAMARTIQTFRPKRFVLSADYGRTTVLKRQRGKFNRPPSQTASRNPKTCTRWAPHTCLAFEARNGHTARTFLVLFRMGGTRRENRSSQVMVELRKSRHSIPCARVTCIVYFSIVNGGNH